MGDYYRVEINDKDYSLISTFHTSARISDKRRAEDVQKKYIKLKHNIS